MGSCVVTVLPDDLAATVRRLRRELAAVTTATVSHATTAPHLTLAVLHDPVDPQAVAAALARVVAATRPFSVTGAGIGVFVGRSLPCPVLHLAFTRAPALSALHRRVVEEVGAVARVDGQTAPDVWRPHVTLTDEGLTADAVGASVRHLVLHGPRHWTLRVDNLALLAPDGVADVLRLTGRAPVARPRLVG